MADVQCGTLRRFIASEEAMAAGRAKLAHRLRDPQRRTGAMPSEGGKSPGMPSSARKRRTAIRAALGIKSTGMPIARERWARQRPMHRKRLKQGRGTAWVLCSLGAAPPLPFFFFSANCRQRLRAGQAARRNPPSRPGAKNPNRSHIRYAALPWAAPLTRCVPCARPLRCRPRAPPGWHRSRLQG